MTSWPSPTQDETLVHCSFSYLESVDFVFNVEYGDGVYEVYVRLRPHFRTFLERVSEMFEVSLLEVPDERPLVTLSSGSL